MPQKITTLKTSPSKPSSGRTKLSTRRWMRTRNHALKLRREDAATRDVALCEHCELEGKRYRLQRVEGHHRIPRSERPDLTHNLDNIQFLCKKHHSLCTALEQVEKLPNRWVVTGPPGAGKTTLIKQRAAKNALVWDADAIAAELGYGAYPRAPHEEEKLHELRRIFIQKATKSLSEIWLIARWPSTAYRIAIKLGAKVIELKARSD